MTLKNIAIAAAIAMTALGASAQTGKSPFFAEIGYAALNYSEPGYSVNPSAIRANFGYELNENLAFEGILALGTTAGSARSGAVTVDLKVDSTFGIYVKPKAKLAPGFEVFGRLGYATTKVTASASSGAATTAFSAMESAVSYGVGMSYALSPSTSLNLDYMSYIEKNGGSVKGMTFGVGFKF